MSSPDAPPPSLVERILASVPGLARYVRARMGPELAARESASDIVQSTCRELLRGAAGFEDRGEASFQRWVRATAEHKLQNRARHWRAERRSETPAPLDAAAEPPGGEDLRPSREAMLHEEVERLERAFARLTPQQRELVVGSQLEGRTPAELARGTGRSPEATRKLLARALAKLALAMEDASGPGRDPGEGEARRPRA